MYYGHIYVTIHYYKARFKTTLKELNESVSRWGGFILDCIEDSPKLCRGKEKPCLVDFDSCGRHSYRALARRLEKTLK